MFLSDENIPLVFSVLAFTVICLLGVGVMVFARGIRHRRSMLKKIRTADKGFSIIDQESPAMELSSGPDSGFLKFLSSFGLKTNPRKSPDDAQIKLKFLKAGLKGRNVPSIFWGAKSLLAIALPVAFFLIAGIFFQALPARHVLFGGMFLALIGLLLPDIWLRAKIKTRKEKLTRAFPDALDLLVVCVEAGMGLDAAISRVGEEVSLNHPELGRELNLLNLELRAGKPRQTALRNLANRTDIDDVHNLVTLLIQTDRFGTSIAQALRVFADSFRTARFQRAEELAAKMATKMVIPLVLFIFPSFFVVAIGPAAVQVYRVLLKG